MLSKVMRVGAAGFCVLTLGLMATAQQPVVQPGGVQPAAPAVTTYRAKQVLGSKIMIQNNTAVGTVDDIVFDSAGNLEYLIVARDDSKLLSVPWDAAKFDLKSQTATLAITPDVYKTIPTFTTTTYPEFWTPTYRTTTYKYYGLTPRELRRFERRNP